jgi:hypothetical protein
MRVVEAASSPAADGADSYPSSSIESFRDQYSSGRYAIRCDASTMKRLMGFDGMTLSSGMINR